MLQESKLGAIDGQNALKLRLFSTVALIGMNFMRSIKRIFNVKFEFN